MNECTQTKAVIRGGLDYIPLFLVFRSCACVHVCCTVDDLRFCVCGCISRESFCVCTVYLHSVLFCPFTTGQHGLLFLFCIGTVQMYK